VCASLVEWGSGMLRFRNFVVRFAGDRRGTTAIEYCLIASLVAIGMLAGLRALGSGNSSSWGDTANKITNAMQGGG
jgi:pilus assembly protein Flp/PilA